MQHSYDLENARLSQPSVVTIGVFDGVHRGHQHLIRRLVDHAHAQDRQAVAITFFPHPDVVLRHLEGRYYLTTPEQKAQLLADLGVDLVVTQTFDDEFRQIRAAQFVDMMREHVGLAELWVGSDFAMGYKREGDVAFLRRQGQDKGFALEVVDLVAASADVISSTTIREALLQGDVERAREGLGRAYSVTGEVIHGEKRGRLLGFPTANLDVWNQQVIPANGIYAGWATLGDERFMAMTNVGVRPHFAGQNVTVEAYLLDFDRDIYGQQVELTFDRYLRPEMKFNGLDELIAQIHDDVRVGRAYLMQQESV